MGFARACSVALVGVEGVVVEVQADLEAGVAAFTLVGLPDKSLVESRDRVRAAVVNSGAEWPQKKLTVGLSPASVPKGGSGFDLAVACAVLGAAERIDPESIADVVMIGELGLDGRVRPVRGVLPAVLAAADAGYRQVVVPEQTAGEAALVPGVSVLGVRSLRQLIAVLCDEPVPEERQAHDEGRPDTMLAGLMVPGAGIGTGLARGPTRATATCRISRTWRGSCGPARRWRSPRRGSPSAALRAAGCRQDHAGRAIAGDPARVDEEGVPGGHRGALGGRHSAVGGTAGYPGAVLRTAPLGDHAVVGRRGQRAAEARCGLLAHRGILFLDEAPEFSMRVLDALRQPLESGHVVVARSAGVVRLPARFLMVLAANPCPCGRHRLSGAGCECAPSAVRRYQSRLSGPLLDRVDLRVAVDPVRREDLMGQSGRGESTATVAARVREARARAAERLAGTAWTTNSEVPGHELRTRLVAAPGALMEAERDMERGMLTARGLDRVLRVAWTVADLRGADRPEASDIAVALELRTGIPGAP